MRIFQRWHKCVWLFFAYCLLRRSCFSCTKSREEIKRHKESAKLLFKNSWVLMLEEMMTEHPSKRKVRKIRKAKKKTMKQIKQAFDEVEQKRKMNAEEMQRLSEQYEQRRKEQEELQKENQKLRDLVSNMCQVLGIDEGEFYKEMNIKM